MGGFKTSYTSNSAAAIITSVDNCPFTVCYFSLRGPKSIVRDVLLVSSEVSSPVRRTSSGSNCHTSTGSLFGPLAVGKCSTISFTDRGPMVTFDSSKLGGTVGVFRTDVSSKSSLWVFTTPARSSSQRVTVGHIWHAWTMRITVFAKQTHDKFAFEAVVVVVRVCSFFIRASWWGAFNDGQLASFDRFLHRPVLQNSQETLVPRQCAVSAESDANSPSPVLVRSRDLFHSRKGSPPLDIAQRIPGYI